MVNSSFPQKSSDPIDFGVEPSITASVYASGAVDAALTRWAAPLQEHLRSEAPGSFLWLWRYSRHGEHLKLRIHCASDVEDHLREKVEETAHGFLESLGPRPEGEERKAARFPAIDLDEDDGEPPPDRSFRFTRFQHWPPMLGGPPFSDSDDFVARFYGALGAGHDWFLRRLADAGEWSPGLRDELLAVLVRTSLERLHEADQHAEYLAYYRDWLIRFPLLKLDAPQKQADLWTLKLRKRSAESSELPTFEASLESAHLQPWLRATDRLSDHVLSHRDDPRYDVDPHSRHPLNPPLNKLHLAFGNALGFGMTDQALLIHRLLERISPERAEQPVQLRVPQTETLE